MKHAISILLLASSFLFLIGCMPLKQTETIQESSDISGSYEDGYILLYVDQEYWDKKYTIDPVSSYVLGPNGKQYEIKTETHEYDLQNHSKKPRERIYIKSKDGEVINRWEDGVWKLVLNLKNKDSVKIKELEIKIWTFIYSPLIHGAPN
jgi:hypothetical protein